MSGVETTPVDLAGGPSADELAVNEVMKNVLNEKNGIMLYTRMLLATSDCPDGYSSAASLLVVQVHAPIELDGFGDGRSAAVQ